MSMRCQWNIVTGPFIDLFIRHADGDVGAPGVMPTGDVGARGGTLSRSDMAWNSTVFRRFSWQASSSHDKPGHHFNLARSLARRIMEPNEREATSRRKTKTEPYWARWVNSEAGIRAASV